MTRLTLRECLMAGLFAALAAGPASAQDKGASARSVLDSAKQSNQQLRFEIDRSTGLPTRIIGITPRTASPSIGATERPTEAQVRAAAEGFFNSGALSAAFETSNPQTRYQSTKVRRDPDVPGQTIVQVEQRVGGVPVFGSNAKVVVGPSLGVSQLTANLSMVEVASTIPKTERAQAVTAARQYLRANLTRRSGDGVIRRLLERLDTVQPRSEPELVIFDPALLKQRGAGPGGAKLAWLVTLDTFRIFVDADTAAPLYLFRDQPFAQQRRIFDLEGRHAFPGRKTIDEASGERVEPVSTDAGHAFHNSGRVLEFFAQVFGRRGILEDDAAVFESYVQYADAQGAYWCVATTFDCPRANVMVYAPRYAAAMDVTAHEATHGVIMAEANLIYADEPGAVNEALADTFSTLAEFHARGGNGNWVLGEELPNMSLTSPLRSLANPPLMDGDGKPLFSKSKPYDLATNRGQPEHYDDYVERDDEICRLTSDYFVGCVHFNSGIFNKFAFLIAEGGRHRGVVVKGIGRSKLGRIAYRALTTQLTASSGLAQAATAFVQACADLQQSGIAGITAEDCDRVRDAQLATGLGIPTG